MPSQVNFKLVYGQRKNENFTFILKIISPSSHFIVIGALHKHANCSYNVLLPELSFVQLLSSSFTFYKSLSLKTESHNLFGKFRINHMKLEILLTDWRYIFIHHHGDLIRKQSPHLIILPDVTETRHKWCCHCNLHISCDCHTCWFMVKPVNGLETTYLSTWMKKQSKFTRKNKGEQLCAVDYSHFILEMVRLILLILFFSDPCFFFPIKIEMISVFIYFFTFSLSFLPLYTLSLSVSSLQVMLEVFDMFFPLIRHRR